MFDLKHRREFKKKKKYGKAFIKTFHEAIAHSLIIKGNKICIAGVTKRTLKPKQVFLCLLILKN